MSSQPGTVLVVGGANVDLTARSTGPFVPGTSNPGVVARSAGGVARNIAENLARLSTPVRLAAAVGPDELGSYLTSVTEAAGVDVGLVQTTAATTGSYLAVLDSTGELVGAIADMAATDALSPANLGPVIDAVRHSSFLVLDANLPVPAVEALLGAAAQHRVPVVVDPVSDVKAVRIAPLLQPSLPVHTIGPNRSELAVLVGRPLVTDADIADAARELHRRGVGIVWVRLGVDGSLLSTADGSVVRLPAHSVDVADVTGAGDAMTAGYVHALANGASVPEAARFGTAAAAVTVTSRSTVHPQLAERARRLFRGHLEIV